MAFASDSFDHNLLLSLAMPPNLSFDSAPGSISALLCVHQAKLEREDQASQKRLILKSSPTESQGSRALFLFARK
jgi:hypothetical protein